MDVKNKEAIYLSSLRFWNKWMNNRAPYRIFAGPLIQLLDSTSVIKFNKVHTWYIMAKRGEGDSREMRRILDTEYRSI